MVQYLVILVLILHAIIALILRDDLSRIFDDNLVWLEGSIASHTISAIGCLDHFDSNVVFTPPFVPLLELFEATVIAAISADIAIGIITLVEHVTVKAIVVTSTFERADASGRL